MTSMEIFIVSFHRDADWLAYNLKSIRKYCTGFAGTTLLVPLEDAPLFEPVTREYGVRLYTFHQHPTKGMLHHEAMICRADQFCEADLILHTDSDCCFTKPVTPEFYMKGGKPVMLRRPYASVGDKTVYGWKKCVEEALGLEVIWETMCRHPSIHYRWLYPEVRAHIEKTVKMPFDDYVLSQRNEFPQTFAEFPTLGAYACKFHEDKYACYDLTTNEGDEEFHRNALQQKV